MPVSKPANSVTKKKSKHFSDVSVVELLESNVHTDATTNKQLHTVTKVVQHKTAVSDPSPVASSDSPSANAEPAALTSTDPTSDEANELYEQSLSGQPDRKELCRLMGVDYKNHKEKIRLRKHLKGYFTKWLRMDKPFTQYNYHTDVYPVVKSSTIYMNKNFLTGKKWSKEVTQYVIHAIFEDTRRNRTQAAKRRNRKLGNPASVGLLTLLISINCLHT
jgi:hypothetical protein